MSRPLGSRRSTVPRREWQDLPILGSDGRIGPALHCVDAIRPLFLRKCVLHGFCRGVGVIRAPEPWDS